MPRPGTLWLRLTAALLSVATVGGTYYLGRLFLALFLYYGTPGQTPEFYLTGRLVLLAITTALLALWTATAYILYRASSKQ